MPNYLGNSSLSKALCTALCNAQYNVESTHISELLSCSNTYISRYTVYDKVCIDIKQVLNNCKHTHLCVKLQEQIDEAIKKKKEAERMIATIDTALMKLVFRQRQ